MRIFYWNGDVVEINDSISDVSVLLTCFARAYVSEDFDFDGMPDYLSKSFDNVFTVKRGVTTIVRGR